MQYHEFELGLSGTGLPTATWQIDYHTETDLRAIINVLVNGVFNSEEAEFSSRYIKVKGNNGSIQWASKKISSARPDIQTCTLPEPFVSS
ncbi:hypothetical protein [Rheinheimera hassiensis]|uniref:hypothetical protein n=1 Tax=Rheinheimera hassiensis TaxID=1193627 RepID=UPI001F065C79|nr:hypothetical protein [Rheinheimera hassiensis]